MQVDISRFRSWHENSHIMKSKQLNTKHEIKINKYIYNNKRAKIKTDYLHIVSAAIEIMRQLMSQIVNF